MPSTAPAGERHARPEIARIVMSCADRPGIVASVASFLHRSGANIVQSDQYSTGPTSGQFFLRTEFHLPGVAARIPDIERQFADEVASALGAQFRLRDASVPARVALFVSRQDHCLLDLLWRERRGELPLQTVLVISNHLDLGPDVVSFGVPFEHVPVTSTTKAAAERRQLELLRGNVDLVVLARYMQILSPAFLEQVGVPHQHPPLLPARVRRRRSV